jgi:hypothetical protein
VPGWPGVRDGTRFGPSCPQPANPALTGPTSEDTDNAPVLSLVPPRPQAETDFTARHHCAFWAAG